MWHFWIELASPNYKVWPKIAHWVRLLLFFTAYLPPMLLGTERKSNSAIVVVAIFHHPLLFPCVNILIYLLWLSWATDLLKDEFSCYPTYPIDFLWLFIGSMLELIAGNVGRQNGSKFITIFLDLTCSFLTRSELFTQ